MNSLFCFLLFGIVCISAMYVDNSKNEMESQILELKELNAEDVSAS